VPDRSRLGGVRGLWVTAIGHPSGRTLQSPGFRSASAYGVLSLGNEASMNDTTAFSGDELKTLSEAPRRVTLAVIALGEHGPISIVKEAAASARAIAHPGERGPADELIAHLAQDAENREARHDVKVTWDRSPPRSSTPRSTTGPSPLWPSRSLASRRRPRSAPGGPVSLRPWRETAKSVTADERAVFDRIAVALAAAESSG